MAKRVFSTVNMSWIASASGAAITSPTTPQWMAIKGGNGTAIIDILEILISGLASASTLGGFLFSRVTALESAAGGAALTTSAPKASDGVENPSAQAITNPVVVFNAASTTGPTPSNVITNADLNLGLNMFGGIIRWNAAPTQQWWVVGNTTTTGESILYNSSSAGGATGLASAHILYEPY
jgi:hypothetical protein